MERVRLFKLHQEPCIYEITDNANSCQYYAFQYYVNKGFHLLSFAVYCQKEGN